MTKLVVTCSPELKDRFDSLLDRKKISQQDALNSVIEFLLQQDDYLQTLILGQMSPKNTQALAQTLLEALAQKSSVHRLGRVKRRAGSAKKNG